MNTRKIAAALVAAGLMAGLVGAGISATYTDNASAVINAQVGTFACSVTSTDPNAVVNPAVPGGPDTSVTINEPAIQSSSSTSVFVSDVTVHNNGSIPMQVHWSFTTAGTIVWQPTGRIGYYTGTGNVGDPGNMRTDFTLAAGASKTYTNFGFGWASLVNADLGTSGSVTATANCGEQPTTSGIQFIAAASDGSNIALPAACQPGDLALAFATFPSYNHWDGIVGNQTGWTNTTHYGYSNAAIGNVGAYKVLAAGDTSITTAGTYPANAIEVACYRHAALAVGTGGALFIGDGNAISSATLAVSQPPIQFGSGSLPTDGSAAVVEFAGTSATGTNIASMFNPPVAITTPPGFLANRSASLSSAQAGLADTVASIVTTWPAGGSTLASWTQSPASNHSFLSFGIVYAP